MKKNEDAAAKKKPKTSAAQIRVQKGVSSYPNGRPGCLEGLITIIDLTELDLPSTMKTHFPDPADLLNFTLTITPDEGLETRVPSSSNAYLRSIQECIVAEHSYSRLRSTTATPMNHQKSSAHKPYALLDMFSPQHAHGIKIYHPNVDLEGNVCLNILREDWKPVLNLNSVMVGLQYLFLEPNADDPLNKGRRSWLVSVVVY